MREIVLDKALNVTSKWAAHNAAPRIHWSTWISEEGFLLTTVGAAAARISYELSVSGYGCRKQVWDRAKPPPSLPMRRIRVANIRSRKMETLCPRQIRDFVRSVAKPVVFAKREKKGRSKKQTARGNFRTAISAGRYHNAIVLFHYIISNV